MKRAIHRDTAMNEELLKKFNEVESYHWWWEGRRRLVGDFLRAMDRKKGKILDVGCGTGETMAFVKKNFQGWKVWGLDASPEAVNYTKRRGFPEAILAKADKLPVKSNEIDAILLLDVIEHLHRPVASVLEMKRVLKPGGKMLITCPALKLIWSKHDEGQGHKMRYERKEMRELARKSGMILERVKYFNFVMSLPIIMIRLLGKVPGARFLANYDNGVNFETAKVKPINTVLRKVFVTEVAWLSKLTYPWGISIMAVLVKPKD